MKLSIVTIVLMLSFSICALASDNYTQEYVCKTQIKNVQGNKMYFRLDLLINEKVGQAMNNIIIDSENEGTLSNGAIILFSTPASVVKAYNDVAVDFNNQHFYTKIEWQAINDNLDLVKMKMIFTKPEKGEGFFTKSVNEVEKIRESFICKLSNLDEALHEQVPE